SGGYDAFTFDITDRLNGGTKELVVKAWDPTDPRHNGSVQPIWKQTKTPNGIFYTPSSGIWQTVWLEPTPASSISSVDLTPSRADNTLRGRVFPPGTVTA